MIAVDLENHEVLKNWEIKQRIAKQHPYGEWLQQYRQELKQIVSSQSSDVNGNGNGHSTTDKIDKQTLLQRQTAFGYTTEDVEMVIHPMAIAGSEPTFCMGDDIPLAVLSQKPHLLYDYFKQRFAQVTNPAIDPLREKLVMSLKVELGERGNLLEPKPEYARRLKLESPLLAEVELEAIKLSGFATAELSTLFAIATGPEGLKAAVESLQAQAAESVRAGAKILILSDAYTGLRQQVNDSISTEYTYIPPLLAVGAVHHHLIREGLRMKTSLIVNTAQCWSTHHFACLIGYGAGAVCPYMALDTLRDWWSDPKTQKLMGVKKIPALTLAEALGNYRKAVESGLLKILSKMGISLLSSY